MSERLDRLMSEFNDRCYRIKQLELAIEDCDFIDFDGCWKTKDKAKEVSKKVRLLLQMEQIHDILCPDYKHDWGNNRLMSNGLEYDNSKNIWCATIGYPCVVKGFAHFDTLEHAKQAAKILNDMGIKP